MMRDVQLTAIQPLLEQLAALSARQSEQRPIVQEEAMLRLRGDLRKLLVAVRGELARGVTEREVYLVLFPLVVHLDELVQTGVVDTERLAWPMLQKDLFDTDKGGQLFYRALDEILEGRAAPFIYQVYFFCLRLGFRGQLLGDEERVTAYLRKLYARFPAPPASTTEPAFEEPGSIPKSRSPLWYYLPAAALMVLLYVLLHVVAGSDADALREKEQAPFRPSRTATSLAPTPAAAPMARVKPSDSAAPVVVAAAVHRDPIPRCNALLVDEPYASDDDQDAAEDQGEGSPRCRCRGELARAPETDDVWIDESSSEEDEAVAPKRVARRPSSPSARGL